MPTLLPLPAAREEACSSQSAREEACSSQSAREEACSSQSGESAREEGATPTCTLTCLDEAAATPRLMFVVNIYTESKYRFVESLTAPCEMGDFGVVIGLHGAVRALHCTRPHLCDSLNCFPVSWDPSSRVQCILTEYQ